MQEILKSQGIYRVEKEVVEALQIDTEEFFDKVHAHFMEFDCYRKAELLEDANGTQFWGVTIAPNPRSEMERFFDTVYGDKNQVIFETPDGYIGYEEYLSLYPRKWMHMKVDFDYTFEILEDEIPDGYSAMEVVFGLEAVYLILEKSC